MKQHILIFFLFAIALLFFHFVFRDKSKRFWIKIDYLVIFFGLISIVGIVFNIKNEDAIKRLLWEKDKLNHYYNQHINNLKIYSHYFDENGSFDYGKFDNKEMAKSMIEAGEFLREQLKWASEYKNPILENGELAYIDSLDANLKTYLNDSSEFSVTPILKQINENMTMLQETKRSIISLYRNSYRNTFESIIYLLSPFALSILLALRLTKVTAQLRENKKENIPN